MPFWDSLSPVAIRNESGLTYQQVREQSDATMLAYVQNRIVENARFVRRKINEAAGRFTFGVEGFSNADLMMIFADKVTSGGYLTEGEDIVAMACEATRFRTLYDLESRNKAPGGDLTGNITNQARTYKTNAEEREQSIIDTLTKALAVLDADGEDSGMGVSYSVSVPISNRW